MRFFYLSIFISLIASSCNTNSTKDNQRMDSLYPKKGTFVKYQEEWAIDGYYKRLSEFKASPIVKRIKYADVSQVLEGGNNEGDKLLLRFHNKKIVKYVSFQLFDNETGNKTSSKAIFSKFIGQLFGSKEVIDID